MNTKYTVERNIQILISLLKAHGVRKIIASPGTTNITIVASMQSDPYFEMYSSVDERSAAYLACGLSAETGEPVALTCTGATASRNYMSGLTEAYYRKLPILAITAGPAISYIGHNFPQVLDRSSVANDILVHNVYVGYVNNEEEEWDATNKINVALMALTRKGCGPVNINIATKFNSDFSVTKIKNVNVISRYTYGDQLPDIDSDKIGIFIGSHNRWNEFETRTVERFCESHNSIVFGDHTSNYKGKYFIQDALLGQQEKVSYTDLNLDLLIYIGNVSGAYTKVKGCRVWRVNPDGELRNVFKNTECIFEMKEEDFFNAYSTSEKRDMKHYENCRAKYDNLMTRIPELPFSNLYCAQKMSEKLPDNAVLHLGILNSLRCWNFFEVNKSVNVYSNVGGFGIDGDVSSLIGASLSNPNKLYFGVVGDLAFFYDMNVIGNHIIGSNIRLLVVNNGRGTEFRNYSHPASQFGDDADAYIAAAGHFGNKSKVLIKDYVENLGYGYLCASTKEEFEERLNKFVNMNVGNQSIIFEVFTNSSDESDALKLIRNLEESSDYKAKNILKTIIGENNTKKLKRIIKG